VNKRFVILEQLGQGGHGKVYRARDEQLDRVVAIKVFHDAHPEGERLMKEARTLCQLKHPGIINVYDVGRVFISEGPQTTITLSEDGGAQPEKLVWAMIMEDLGDLDPFQYVEESGADEALRIVADIAEALQTAHERGIFHCDLNNNNVRIVGNRAVVFDFSLAARQPGRPYGTPACRAPEQTRGDDKMLDHDDSPGFGDKPPMPRQPARAPEVPIFNNKIMMLIQLSPHFGSRFFTLAARCGGRARAPKSGMGSNRLIDLADHSSPGAQATLDIDLGALADNWRRLAVRAAPGECAAVVKADAYGLGIGAAAPALTNAGARTFCVAHLSEALRVRALAPRATIYLLNGLPPADVAALAPARIRPVLGSLEQIARWRAAGAGPCAVQIDTGMNRFGLSCADAATLHPGDLEALGVELLITHFVASEEPGNPLNAGQIAAFEAARARFLDSPASLANSSALFLPDLPVAALEAGDETQTALTRAGLRTIGALLDRPSAPLAARFGMALTTKLARLAGKEDRRITPLRSPPDVTARTLFAEPFLDIAGLEGALAPLLEEACAALRARGQGGRAFEVLFFRTDGAVRSVEIETAAPTRAADAIARLFRLRHESLADPLDPGFGFDEIRLHVRRAQTLRDRQSRLDGEEETEDAVAGLAERLAARLGRERVRVFRARDAHWPERASTTIPFEADLAPPTWPERSAGAAPARPLRLFEPPEPIEALAATPDEPPVSFRWRRVWRKVARAEGPERIAPEWWRRHGESGGAEALTRDYYRLEDEQGRRYWAFREGLYERETATPRWRLHGVFA
jgi:protein ImuB